MTALSEIPYGSRFKTKYHRFWPANIECGAIHDHQCPKTKWFCCIHYCTHIKHELLLLQNGNSSPLPSTFIAGIAGLDPEELQPTKSRCSGFVLGSSRTSRRVLCFAFLLGSARLCVSFSTPVTRIDGWVGVGRGDCGWRLRGLQWCLGIGAWVG